MRMLCLAVVLGCALAAPAVTWADDDPRAEMAAALIDQADLHPAPLVLPIIGTSPRQAVAPASGKSHGLAKGQDAAKKAAHAADKLSHSAQKRGASEAAHEAQDAASSAAGQAQSKAAKQRKMHRNPK